MSIIQPVFLAKTSTSKSSKSLTTHQTLYAHSSIIVSLHKLGWPKSTINNFFVNYLSLGRSTVTNIVNEILNSSYPSSTPLPLNQWLTAIKLEKLISTEHLDRFISSVSRWASNHPSTSTDKPCYKLSEYDVSLINILVMFNWKKTRIAQTFNISSALVSNYTKFINPFHYDDLHLLVNESPFTLTFPKLPEVPTDTFSRSLASQHNITLTSPKLASKILSDKVAHVLNIAASA